MSSCCAAVGMPRSPAQWPRRRRSRGLSLGRLVAHASEVTVSHSYYDSLHILDVPPPSIISFPLVLLHEDSDATFSPSVCFLPRAPLAHNDWFAGTGRLHTPLPPKAWDRAAVWQLTVPARPIIGVALRMSCRNGCPWPVIICRPRRPPRSAARRILIQDTTWAVYETKFERV